MQSCSQSTEMIFIIECKLVIAVFCLNQLRKVKHQTEKYCRFKTRTYCLLQAVPNKFFAYYSTFSDQYLDFGLHIIWWCCQMGVLSKLQSCSEMKSVFSFFPFPAPDHFYCFTWDVCTVLEKIFLSDVRGWRDATVTVPFTLQTCLIH